MDNRALAYDLIRQAFLDIRYFSYSEKGYKGIFKVTNLLHNLPSEIEIIERENGDFSEIIEKLKERAQMLDCKS
ncbi:hypothetical protein [Beggiatoa leptomitoformis]|uniref:Uncharacterized protein n=1 Tax=Beggiatoa leptomitoformis TaxID=288004 RepID=A0A2N9YE11_9GAMM|nr:hypothetical protein [Beggiatoa leptomitoformis]ALG68898.1 hypothetical protein AL038_15840 [Beggiatoa leptomitoformis]AUI68727.1 hypothetical protein BLE401_08420 [Beggiatoa leptomitoformis]